MRHTALKSVRVENVGQRIMKRLLAVMLMFGHQILEPKPNKLRQKNTRTNSINCTANPITAVSLIRAWSPAFLIVLFSRELLSSRTSSNQSCDSC